MGIFTFVSLCNPVNYDTAKYAAPPAMVYSSGFGTYVPACGKTQLIVQCNIKNTGVCLASGQQQYTQACK
jgi:hypothetical protein